MKAHAFRMVLMLAAFVPFPSFATIASCQDPPGPPGIVRCIHDDMALCEATGRATVSQCLERPRGGRREEQRAILTAILRRPPTEEELTQLSAALATGALKIDNSVFTFDSRVGPHDDQRWFGLTLAEIIRISLEVAFVVAGLVLYYRNFRMRMLLVDPRAQERERVPYR